MTVDVVIATKDRHDDLQHCLESLARQTAKPERVIVIDASSTPYALAVPAGLAVEMLPSPPGTLQRNIGLDLARASLVGFFDDDVELEPDYFERIADWLEQHPACVGVSGNIVNERPRSRGSKIYRRLFALAADDGVLLRSGEVAYVRLPTRATRVDSLSGGNMIFRLQEIATLRFDEELPYYAEDVDFSLRASRHGELWMIPDARLVHRKSPESRPPQREYVRRAIATSGYLFAKHRREFGLRRTAFARKIIGRSIAYVLLSFARRSPGAALGVLDGLTALPRMMARGAARERT